MQSLTKAEGSHPLCRQDREQHRPQRWPCLALCSRNSPHLIIVNKEHATIWVFDFCSAARAACYGTIFFGQGSRS